MNPSNEFGLGYIAYYEGFARDANPNLEDTKGHKKWDKGWREAKKRHRQLVTLNKKRRG